ncbi:unnamed protein product, partial [Ixodes pacificus]
GEANINLLSEEQLDGRLSPELWPETIPGVTAFASLVPVSPSFSFRKCVLSGSSESWPTICLQS